MILCTLAFGKIFQGAGMNMTNNGTGIYYSPGLTLNEDSQFIADIGIHIDARTQTMNSYSSSYQNRVAFMRLLAGYRKELAALPIS